MEGGERFGHYGLLKRLATSASGDVYLARPLDPSSGVPPLVVIKRVLPELMSEPRIALRFRHETEIAALIDSPHVAKLYDAGCVGDILYAAIEFIAGWPLDRVHGYLSEARIFPSIRSVVRIALDVLEGLRVLHEAKGADGRPLHVVHRDISPKNVILGEDRSARIIDLGIGKSLLQQWRTKTGSIIGTPGYMSPEQANASAIDHRTDLYAVGVVIWELLTLEHYVPRGNLHSMLLNSLRPAFVLPSAHRADVPGELDRVLERCLMFAPEARFQSASEMSAALERAVPEASDASEEEPLRTLVGEMLWQEAAAAKTEMSALACATEDAMATPETTERSIVFTVRSNVTVPKSSEYNPAWEPTAPAAARKRGARAWIVAAAVSAVAAAVVVLGSGLDPEAEQPAAIITPTAPPRVELRPSVESRAAAPESEPRLEPEPEPVPAASHGPRRHRARAIVRDEPAQTAQEDPRDYVKRVTERAMQLRHRLGEREERKSVDRLLVELSLIARAPDREKTAAIEAELDQLAKRNLP